MKRKSIAIFIASFLVLIGCTKTKKYPIPLFSGSGGEVESATSTGTLNTVEDATLTSISVTEYENTIASGTYVELVATGIYSNGGHKDLTSVATWSVDSSVGESQGSGVVKGNSVGSAVVTATYEGISGNANLTVTAATLVSIQVSQNDSIAAGTTAQYSAIGVFSDGSTQDLTNFVTWSSGDSSVSISDASGSKGLATGNSAGTSTITATFSGVSGTSDLTVSAATVVSLQIVPVSGSIAAGTSTQFQAIATLSDGSTVTVTDLASWASGATSTANIYNTGSNKGLALGYEAGTATISATYGGVTATYDLTITSATLTSISINGDASIAKGTGHQFTATGTFSDGTTQDITNIVTWTTTDQSIGSISNAAGTEGYSNGNATGSVTITATVGSTSATANLSVTAATLASIAVTPNAPSVAKGLYQQFTAVGTFSDGSTQDITSMVTWSSATTANATISNASGSNGKAYAKAVGTSAITASMDGVTSNTATMTVSAATVVSLSVTPTSPSVAKGNTQAFVATAVYTDDSSVDVTTSAAWSSATIAVATISNAGGSEGQASTLTEGSSVITASFGGQTATSTLTVTGAVLTSIAIDQTNPSIANGTSTNLTATATFSDGTTLNITDLSSWTSSATGVATVGSTSGTFGAVTSASEGSTTITITYNGQTATTTLTVSAASVTSIQVTPSTASIAKGYTQQYTATGVYTDGSNQDITTSVTWASSDTSKATISNAGGSNGLATTVDVGSTGITASLGGVTSNSATLTVTSAVLVSLQIDQGNVSIAKGSSQNFTVTGIYSDGTSQNLTTTVAWSSSATGVATISNASGTEGNADTYPSGQGSTGTSTITASYGGITTNVTLTVTNASLASITVSPSSASVVAGLTQDYTATGNYTDGSTQDLTSSVTWNSSSTANATISNGSNKGRATAVAQGSSTITASQDGVTSNSATLTVTAATLVSLAINQGNLTLAKGTTQNYTVTGTYTDGSTQDLTTSVTWTSSATGVATISNVGGSEGTASVVGSSSSTNITATLGGVTSPAVTLTASPATLVSISIGGDATINVGGIKFYTATGTYSDGTTQDITSSVTWTTSASGVASVSNASGSQGKATGNSAGTSTITATLSGISGSGVLTVNAGSGSGSSTTNVGNNNVTLPSDVTQGTTPTGDFEGITYFKEPNLSGFIATTPDYGTSDCSGYGAHLLGLVNSTSGISSISQVSSTTKTNTDGCSVTYNLQVTTSSSMKVTELSNALIEQIGIQIVNGSVGNLPSAQGSETDATEFRVVIQATYSNSGTETVGVGVSTESDYSSNEATLTNLLDGTNISNAPADTTTTDSFTGDADPKADFVWVVDNSGSMSSAQNAVSNAATTFFSKLGGKHLDYNLTAITTASSSLQGGGWTTSQTTFQDKVTPGTSGSGTESGIHFAQQGLNNSNISPRSGAQVVFIMVSDEGDHYECYNGGSRASNAQSAVPPCVGGTAYDMNSNIFKTNNYKVYSLIGLDSSGNAASCSGTNATAIGNSGWPAYKNLAEATGGFATSICSDSFDSAMDSIVTSVAASSSSYTLSKTPISSTIVVTVGGVTIAKDATNGWSYNSASNSIVFSGTAWPTQGAAITVTYESSSSFFAALTSGDTNQLMAFLSTASNNNFFRLALVTFLAAGFILIGRMFINRRNA